MARIRVPEEFDWEDEMKEIKKRYKDWLAKEPPRNVIDEIHRLVDEGEYFTHQSLGAKFNISATQVGDAALVAQVERRVRQEPIPLGKSEMKASVAVRYETALRVAKKHMREEIINEERAKLHEEIEKYLTHWRERAAWADKVRENYKGHIDRREYRILLACLHPDRHDGNIQYRAMFELIKKLEDVLVKPEPKTSTSSLPASVADLLARRRNRA